MFCLTLLTVRIAAGGSGSTAGASASCGEWTVTLPFRRHQIAGDVFCSRAIGATPPTRYPGHRASSAYRRESSANSGRRASLNAPTINGPSPKPIKLLNRYMRASDVARMRSGTNVCSVANNGPVVVLPMTLMVRNAKDQW